MSNVTGRTCCSSDSMNKKLKALLLMVCLLAGVICCSGFVIMHYMKRSEDVRVRMILGRALREGVRRGVFNGQSDRESIKDLRQSWIFDLESSLGKVAPRSAHVRFKVALAPTPEALTSMANWRDRAIVGVYADGRLEVLSNADYRAFDGVELR